MTKKTTLAAHKAMWSWISAETKRRKLTVKKHEFQDSQYPSLYLCACMCYTCEYAEQQMKKHNPLAEIRPAISKEHCDYCPIQWSDNHETTDTQNNFACCCTKTNQGLYDRWTEACYTNDWQTAAKLAEQIANLPERK